MKIRRQETGLQKPRAVDYRRRKDLPVAMCQHLHCRIVTALRLSGTALSGLYGSRIDGRILPLYQREGRRFSRGLSGRPSAPSRTCGLFVRYSRAQGWRL
jgi:hypothetical protein